MTSAVDLWSDSARDFSIDFDAEALETDSHFGAFVPYVVDPQSDPARSNAPCPTRSGKGGQAQVGGEIRQAPSHVAKKERPNAHP